MKRRGTVILMSLLLSACAADGPPPGGRVSVEAIHAGSFCGARSAGAVWLDDTRALAGWPDGAAGTVPEAAAAAVPFQRRGVVAVSMGRQPTGGYALRLGATEAVISDGVLTLPVDWVEPPADGVATQVLTRPCLLVSVPRGDYHRVLVVDGKGVVRGRVSR